MNATAACPRCGRHTAHPFSTDDGICLRCAGARVFSLALGEPPAISLDPAPGSSDSPPVTRHTSLPPRLGPYELIEEIGRGGMARVHAARHVDLGRIVALKIMPAGRTAPAALELRFLREARTAARLRHPHIVPVHDFGRAGDELYFSMDYIEGGDLARRLRERPPSPREAARLLAAVASAVAYAHAEGVLHRDLKPSNILLDGDTPLLADFGLAAQLEPGGDLTAITSVIGTPHYLAPEALAGGSAALTPASDLYALGVILYELLTGRTPFAGASSAALPALAAGTDPTPPRVFDTSIPSDLETICLHCLAPEPARRYASTAALEADLRAFLDGRPIAARPPGRWQRLIRLASRHRAAATAIAATAVILVLASALSLSFAFRAARARRQSVSDAATTRVLADFLENDLLAQASPLAQPDRDLKLATALQRAADRIGDRFAGQPATEAELRRTLGSAYSALGDYQAAVVHFRRAHDLLAGILPADDPGLLRAASNLATALYQTTDYKSAATIAADTLARQRRVLGPDHADTLATEALLAEVHHYLDHLATAVDLQRDALLRRRATLGADHTDTVTSENQLATVFLDQGRYAPAARLLADALTRRRRVNGPEHPYTLEAMNNLAASWWCLGRLDEAIPLQQQTLELSVRILGADHPDTLRTLVCLAAEELSAGRSTDSIAHYEDACARLARTLGPDHHLTIQTQGMLARAYSLNGRAADAIPLFRTVIESGSRTLGPNHPEMISAIDQLAECFRRLGRPAEAEPLLRTSLAAHEANDERPFQADVSRAMLGIVLLELQRYDEAEPLLTTAAEHLLDHRADLIPDQRRTLSDAVTSLVKLYGATQRPEIAARWQARFDASAKP